MHPDTLLHNIQSLLGEKVTEVVQLYDILTIETTKEQFLEVIEILHKDPLFNFHFLTDICGVHIPDNDSDNQLAVVYHLHNMISNTRIRVKVFLSINNPTIPTLTNKYAAANWMERETYDFFGIKFDGHPNLTRILNMDEMTVFPLRKEYPLEDAGRTDKDDRFFGRTIHNA